jgi:hypothetical protein
MIFYEEDITDLISAIKSNTAAGPSGIDGNYIKSLNAKDMNHLKKLMRIFFNKILNNPQIIG